MTRDVAVQSHPQEQLPPMTISIKELSAERNRYTVWPEFQRQEVWFLKQCQGLIDTILLGDPIPPLEGYLHYNENGEAVWGIVDGHQRISAILAYIDGVYKTWSFAVKRRVEPNSEGPVCPGKLFDQLDLVAKNYILDYRLQINKVRQRSHSEMVTRYLRINAGHSPLSAAERLYAYQSLAKNASLEIRKHAFWDAFYIGKDNRSQKFQSSLQILALEISPEGFVDLQNNEYLYALAAGVRDELVTDEVLASIYDTLNKIAILFSGIFFTERAIIVPMYQTVRMLEHKYGYQVTEKDKGVLAIWIQNILDSSHTGYENRSNSRPVGGLTYVIRQRDFWIKHEREMLNLVGVSSQLCNEADLKRLAK